MNSIKSYSSAMLTGAAAVAWVLFIAFPLTAAESTKEKTMDSVVVVIETSKGVIEAELDSAKAPITVQNFLSYTDNGFYSGTIFHRVIKGFMIQGGGFTAEMKQKEPNPSIKIESANGLKNDRGTLAMARTSDPNSATAQFFINHKNNDFLNYTDPSPRGIGYAVFGRVVSGMDVVDDIAGVPTGTKGNMQDVPVEPVTILSVHRK